MDLTNRTGPLSRRKEYFIVILLLCFNIHWSYASDGNKENVQSLCTSQYCQQFPQKCHCSESTVLWDRQCQNNTCVVYSHQNGHKRQSKYECGECGIIGSECGPNGKNVECQYPGKCESGYCRCKLGSPADGLCLYYNSVTNNKVTLGLIFTLIVLLIIVKIITMNKCFRRRCLPIFSRHCCCRCPGGTDDEEESEIGRNPESGTKSAAFTISTRDFIAPSSDPDLDWALELSRQLNPGQIINEGASTSDVLREGGSIDMPRSSGQRRRMPTKELTLSRIRYQPSSNNYSIQSTSSSISSDYFSTVDDQSTAEVIMTSILQDSTSATSLSETTSDSSSPKTSLSSIMDSYSYSSSSDYF